ncbi:MAG: hypothetical protein AAF170_10805 [Bacteroidota bacterium]
MTARQLEVAAYLILLVGLVGTWTFVRMGLEGGTATVLGTIGLYTMTGLPFGLAAAGSRWQRTSRPASAWLLTVWLIGIIASFMVLIGTQGELFGSLFVFMLPVLHLPAVALATLIAWGIRRRTLSRAGDS